MNVIIPHINTIYLGDNLPYLQGIETESVDLIYFDPPFGTGKDFYTNEGEFVFSDKYSLVELIEFLLPRIKECFRILKPTGSFWLHGDPRFIPYMRVECDHIFNIRHFINEVSWFYQLGGISKRKFGEKHDTLLWYAKSDDYTFNTDLIKIPYSKLREKYTIIEGKEYYVKRDTNSGKMYYTDIAEGRTPRDVWVDIPALNWEEKERNGYPTQKPEELLKRIILACSNEGDTFVEASLGRVRVVVAKRYNRKYIGFHNSQVSINFTIERLKSVKYTKPLPVKFVNKENKWQQNFSNLIIKKS